MADKKETMAFLQAVLDNLEECDKSFLQLKTLFKKTQSLLKEEKRLIFLH